ncbi:MAG TPA: efflux RND transporter periplasmic adaptor subunit [Acidiferrobacterales bacterium]|nr:efflux RND transporter periplasmic adaptor subunit [Acidiferrobacterales bacterium]
MNIRTMQLVAIASLVALLAGCDGRAKPAESPQAKKIDSNTVIFPKDSSQASALSAEPVVSGQSAVLRLNGRLVWNEDKTVRVYTPFSGRVTKILVQAGDLVRAGQSLAILASPDFGQAQADARRALSDFAMAEKNLRRMKELFDHGVVAEKDFVVAEADYARAESEKQRTTARLNLYGNNGGSVDQLFQLTSPLAGVVVEKNINPGQELRPDQVPANGSGLFVITDPSRLWFQLDVSERDLAHIRRGLNVAIRSPAWPDEVFTGKIISISDFLDPQSRALKVRGTLDNTSRKLKGEMFVFGEISVPATATIQVPRNAVYLLGDKHYVFIDEGDGKFVRREVEIGPEQGGFIPIADGLAVGQKVVSSGNLLLQQLLDSGKEP